VLADIVIYDKPQDLALLKVRDVIDYPCAKLYPKEDADKVPLLVPLCACGAALGEKPVVTFGNLNGIQIEIDGYEYWLSSAPSIFGNCLPGDTLVSMSDGTVKEIRDIKVGDLVLGYGFTGLKKYVRVEQVINSGIKKIYEVRTRNRVLRASGNHPVLKVMSVMDWTGRIRNILVWEAVENLRSGDIIAVMRSHVLREEGKGFNFAKEIGQNKNPEMLMRFLGFFVGDGYKRRRECGGEIHLYVYNEEIGKFYERIIKELFDVNVTVVGNYEQLRIYSTKLVEKLSEWGFDGTSKTKSIPDWVMTQIPAYQLAFLQGYVDADGYTNKYNAWVLEAANEKLIKQLRMMAIHLGLQVSNIHYRKREVSFQNRDAYGAETWTFQIYSSYGKDPNSYFEGDRQFLPDDLQYVKVNDVEVVGEEETYDIKLDRCHTFFADGVLVHNSGGGVYTQRDGEWYFLGIPSRISVVFIGFGGSPVTHMGYFIPVLRIYRWLEEYCYQFIYDERYTIEQCEKMREEKRERELAMYMRSQTGEQK
jgi:intein/homing endonuclease